MREILLKAIELPVAERYRLAFMIAESLGYTLDKKESYAAGGVENWIEQEFRGKAVAVRRETDPPIPGEPFMSMADAKDLVRRAVAEAQAWKPRIIR